MVLNDRGVISKTLTRVLTGPTAMVPDRLNKPSTITSITDTEWARRQAAVEFLATDCPYAKDDLVRPVKDEDFNADGFYCVTHIADTYANWKGAGKDSEWPSNDNPMIITARRAKDGFITIATVNYFKK